MASDSINPPAAQDHTDDYEEIGRVTCRKIKALMGEGWRAPFTIAVAGADEELLFTAEYDGSGHFTSTGDGEEVLPR
jgi:hypothetical protein